MTKVNLSLIGQNYFAENSDALEYDTHNYFEICEIPPKHGQRKSLQGNSCAVLPGGQRIESYQTIKATSSN